MQVCSADVPGSGERHVIDLIKAMQERGHDLHLAVRPSSPLPILMDAVKGGGVQVHEFELRSTLDILNAHRLAEIIRRENIDVMHVHSDRDYMFSGIATKITPVRYYLTQHHHNDIPSNPFYPWALRRIRALIGTSAAIKQRLVATFPHLADRTLVIPNWLESLSNNIIPKLAARKRLGITRRLAVGIIGQLTPLKRQDLFIRAAAQLINEREWRDVDFLVIGLPGANDIEYAQHLYKLPDSFGVTDQIKFVGSIDRMPALMSAFDIVAMPSDNEGFPLILIEAMAAGCAVIVSDVAGITEIVEHESNGLIVEHRNLGLLIAGLSKLLVDKELRETIGSNAKSSVRDQYERENVISRIENLYMR